MVRSSKKALIAFTLISLAPASLLLPMQQRVRTTIQPVLRREAAPPRMIAPRSVLLSPAVPRRPVTRSVLQQPGVTQPRRVMFTSYRNPPSPTIETLWQQQQEIDKKNDALTARYATVADPESAHDFIQQRNSQMAPLAQALGTYLGAETPENAARVAQQQAAFASFLEQQNKQFDNQFVLLESAAPPASIIQRIKDAIIQLKKKLKEYIDAYNKLNAEDRGRREEERFKKQEKNIRKVEDWLTTPTK